MCNYLEENINLRREMEDIFKSPSGISVNEKYIWHEGFTV